MNYKSAQARLLSIFLVIGVFFVTILNWEFTVNAQINDNHSSAFNIENDDYNGTCVGKTRISLVSSKKHFLWEENILATYYVSSNESIADISYTQTGFNVISVGVDADNPKYIVVELSCIPTAEEYSMSIQITLDSAKTITARLYAIKNEHGVFISPFSEDDAYQRYFDYAREANIMNEDDYKTIKTALNRIGVTENVFVEEKMVVNNEAATMATNSKTTYIKGTLQWTDDKNNVHPLRGVMVKIYDDEPIGEQLLTTLYTDDEGYYYYSFSNPDDILDFENGGYDIFIRIYAGNDNVMVEFGDNREEYYYPSCVIENIITGSTVTRNINFSMQTDLGNAFQISQALIIAYSYTNVMMEESPMPLTLLYPYYPEDPDKDCFYSKRENRIYFPKVCSEEAEIPNSYSAWDVIMHEYGHHIQHQFGIGENPGINHYLVGNTADDCKNKNDGIKSAWAEAWATVFGMQAQNYYSSFLQNMEFVNNDAYDSFDGDAYLTEINYDCDGEGGEGSIIAVLWDLFDDQNVRYGDEVFIDVTDTITLGHEAYWAVTTETGCKTFSEFIEHFYDEYPEYIDDIGPSLSYYRMASTQPEMSNSENVTHTTTPVFEWVAQGGSVFFPNNKFSLLFYNSEGEKILRIENVENTIDTETHKNISRPLTQSEWDAILYNCTDTFTVAIEAWSEGSVISVWADDSPTTGGYISASSVSYNNPNAQNVLYSGIITNELRWSIFTDGTLYVFGSGDIPNYSGTDAPWYNYKDSITKIVVTGVEFIGSKAFYNLDKVTNVYISDTVTIINAEAFEGCTALISAEFEALAGWMVWWVDRYVYIEPHELVYPDLASDFLRFTNADETLERDTSVTTTLSVLDSGKCGDSAYWVLTSENKLRIYGYGEMYDYTESPWAEYSDSLVSITIAQGITHIGDYAFANCGAATVTLPTGLLSIGEGAFKGCLFADITLPDTLTTIESKAFADCTELYRIIIPKLVNSIGERAFEGCTSMVIMTVNSENIVYRASHNTIVDIAAKKIISGCQSSGIAKDEAITSIGSYAFSGINLTTVYLPSTITSIEYRAFYGCTSLTDAHLSGSVTVIGAGAFENCSSLSSVNIHTNITEIGVDAFKGCTMLTDVTIPASVRTIGEGAFANSGITSLKFICANDWSYGTGTAVSENVLEDASSAAALLKGELVDWALTRDPLMSVAINSKMGWEISRGGTLIIYGRGCMPSYETIATETGSNVSTAPWAAYTDSFTALKIREGIYSIGRCAFYDMDNITTVSLPESLMLIDEYAFYNCGGFTSFHIPEKVFSIGIYTMRRTSITSLSLGSPFGWSVNGIALSGDVNEFYTHLNGGTIDGVVIDSYKYVFKHADSAEGNVIAGGVFADGAMTWMLNDKGTLYVSGTGDMPSFTTTTEPWIEYKDIIRRAVIGEGITSVGRCAFHDFPVLESVTLPSTLITVGEYAFYSCDLLSEVTIPANVTRIEAYAFRRSGLTTVDFEVKNGWSAGDIEFSEADLTNNAVSLLTTEYFTQVWTRNVSEE